MTHTTPADTRLSGTRRNEKTLSLGSGFSGKNMGSIPTSCHSTIAEMTHGSAPSPGTRIARSSRRVHGRITNGGPHDIRPPRRPRIHRREGSGSREPARPPPRRRPSSRLERRGGAPPQAVRMGREGGQAGLERHPQQAPGDSRRHPDGLGHGPHLPRAGRWHLRPHRLPRAAPRRPLLQPPGALPLHRDGPAAAGAPPVPLFVAGELGIDPPLRAPPGRGGGPPSPVRASGPP